MTNSPFQNLPSVDRVLTNQRVKKLVEEYSHQSILRHIRSHLDEARDSITNGNQPPNLDQIVNAVINKVLTAWQEKPRSVINATGVILHTNLGRAPLSLESIYSIEQASRGYTDLELDLKTGKRGGRQTHFRQLICDLTGAESGLAVNNNASALLLGIAAVAAGKEVIVSRSEAVEIGGGFRIPDVLKQSGASLIEVGTTNRTYVSDYAAHITEQTGAILIVHSSNFRVTGFTHAPRIEDVVQVGKNANIPVLHDLGSGCLIDTTKFGLSTEPIPQDSISAGVSLSFFSGDKLLGGPQSGIIIGSSKLINLLSKHPLARAMRLDKLSTAALGATLLHYIKGEAIQNIPVWRMIAETRENLESRAMKWKTAIQYPCSIVEGYSTVGGGSLPGETLPTANLIIESTTGAEQMLHDLRNGETPVVGRIENDHVLLDPRTVLPEEEDTLVRTVNRTLQASK